MNLGFAMQALEKNVEAGGALDQYEIEGPDRPELLQDLAEFQLAAVSALLCACTICGVLELLQCSSRKSWGGINGVAVCFCCNRPSGTP